jgi:hypothetical protein
MQNSPWRRITGHDVLIALSDPFLENGDPEHIRAESEKPWPDELECRGFRS